MTIIELLLIIFGSEILIAIAVLWKDIMIFFNPAGYNKIIMLEMDNNIKIMTKKKKGLTFEFKDGIYNLFLARGVEDVKTS